MEGLNDLFNIETDGKTFFFQNDLGKMKERVSKLTYPTLQHCLRMLYTMNGNSKH